MSSGMLGTKKGMTQVFDEEGNCVAVTALQVGPCTVVQKKTKSADGYTAIQIGYESIKEKKLNKPRLGHLKQKKIAPVRYLREFRVENEEMYKVGQQFDANLFQVGDQVDVIGTTKGKGFQGVMKRHGHSGGPAAHGSHLKRGPGSIGQCTSPGEVMRGQKLPGQMGSGRVTTRNLTIVAVRPEENLVLAKGAVPGPNDGLVFLRLNSELFEKRLSELQSKDDATESKDSSEEAKSES